MVCVCVYSHARCACGNERTAQRSQFSPSAMWVPEIKLSGLVEGALQTEPSLSGPCAYTLSFNSSFAPSKKPYPSKLKLNYSSLPMLSKYPSFVSVSPIKHGLILFVNLSRALPEPIHEDT